MALSVTGAMRRRRLQVMAFHFICRSWLCRPDSDTSSTTSVSASTAPVASAVALGNVTDPSTDDADPSPPPRPPMAAVVSTASCRAPRDSDTGATGIVSASGSARGGSSAWTGGVRSSTTLALHQISLSVVKSAKSNNNVTPRQGYLRFGLPVHSLEPAVPTRALRRSHGVDCHALGWRSRLLHGRPMLCLRF